jgi:hypothetical protein
MSATKWFAAVLVVAALLATSASAIHSVPAFKLDLDLPPAQRWKGAVKTIVDKHGWADSFAPVMELYIPLFLVIPDNVTAAITTFLEANYPDVSAEIRSIGEDLAFHANGWCAICNSSKMNTFVYFYELSHADFLQALLPAELRKSCTGILSLPKNKDQPMIHGRNMDEDPPQGRNMTLKINVFKGGKHVYTMLDWTWLTAGIATTSRIGGVTLEMNWNNDGPTFSLNDIVARITDPKTIPVLQVFRLLNDQALNFSETVSYIMNAQFAAPFYHIISGAGRQGAVLTIESDATKNVAEYLNDTSPVTFMVQTNYDRWLPDTGLFRRTTAENALTMLGRERSGTELGVWMALSTYPVHNTHTMFSALMSVEKEPEAFVRDAMVPQTTW